MLRLCVNALKNRILSNINAVKSVSHLQNTTSNLGNVSRFSTLLRNIPSFPLVKNIGSNILIKSVLNNPKLNGIQPLDIQTRNVTKYSLTKGKRKTVKTVIKRFYRLDWGIWIRTKAGRHRRMWKKSGNRRRRLRQHVFTNSTQSWMLDKMVSPFWRRPKYWVNNPYEPYNTREEYFRTSRKPKDYWND